MPTPSRLASTVASLLLAAAVPAFAQATSPGWMYTMNMTIDSGGKVSSMAIKYQVTDRKLRMEFVQVSGMAAVATAEGMSQILDDRDSSMTMVMPGQNMAMVMHLNDIMGGMPAARTGMTPKIEQHVTSKHTEDLGAGERILGHATHRYRVATTGTMDVTMMGRTCTRTLDSVNELWMATDVDLMPAMRTMLKHYDSAIGANNVAGNLSTVTDAGPPGTAMRTISRTTAVDATGHSMPVTSTMEYVEMSRAPIAASVFEVPASYQTTDMRKMMADLPAGIMDSAIAHAAADKSQPSAQKALCGVSAP